jgi:hypothetical protein
MITVEDLRHSLREHLLALVELYEQEFGAETAARAVPPGGARETPPPLAWPATPPPPADADTRDPRDIARAEEIEGCLVAFDAAIEAAARADRAREAAQRLAIVALERALTTRRSAVAARAAMQRRLAQLGSGLAAPDAAELRRSAEAREATRDAEEAAHIADGTAQQARHAAEAVQRSASAALLAAIQSDPARGNPLLDLAIARAAAAMAKRAAQDADQALATLANPAGARIIDLPRPTQPPHQDPNQPDST